MPALLLALLFSQNSLAAESSVKCDIKLLAVTSAHLNEMLPQMKWDIGRIHYNINNYGLAGRPRTVFVGDRASDSTQTCLIESFAKEVGQDSENCPNYVATEVSSTCDLAK